MKVSRISRTLKPQLVANSNPDPISGPPIITEDGVVLGGNGRTMAMQLAYAKEPESAEKLKSHLVQNARQFGMHPDEVKAINKPILVRRVKAGKDTNKLRALGRRMNESLTQGLDPRTAEVAMGQNYVDKNLTGVLVAGMDHDQTLGDYLASSNSREFINAMSSSGIIDDLNRDEFVDEKSGLLNEDGRMRIERILAARMLPDAAVLSNMSQKARESIARSVPSFLRAEAAGWDIRESLMSAVKADIDFRAGGHKGAGTYMRQVIASSDPDNPAVAVQGDKTAGQLFKMLQRVGVQKTPAGFREFARRAEIAKDAGGSASLFGGDPPETMDTALDKAFGISPESAKAIKETAKAAKAEENRLAEEFGMDPEKERKRKKPKAGKGEDWAASIDSPWTKSVKDTDLTSYLYDSVCKEVAHQVHGQLQRSAVSGEGAFKVDGAKVKREVMAMILHAMGSDESIARAIGAAPIDGKTVDGLIQAFTEMHAPKLSKAVEWWGKPKEMLQKAGGPYLGPRGGKWADAARTIPWKEGGGGKAAKAEEGGPKQAKAISDKLERETKGKDYRQPSKDLDTLYTQAAKADVKLRILTHDVAAEYGGKPLFPPGLKGRARVEEKLKVKVDKDNKPDPSQITDLSRSSIEFKSVARLYQALEDISKTHEIVQFKDRIRSPAQGGYRDMKLLIKIDGHVVEIQLHIEPIPAIKSGPGHAIYEKMRVIQEKSKAEGRPVSDIEKAMIAKLSKQSEKLYGDAFKKAMGATA
jgi:hypothetical protein